jgi:hypothetical protein
MPLLHTIPPPKLPKLHQETKIVDLAPPAMSPFQPNRQPAHAGQHAGASSSAPDEEPIASSFTGAGPPFDFTSMDAPGIWNHGLGSQNAFDSGLNEPWMMPSFDAEEPLFDYTWNYQTDEAFGFDAAVSSQSALGPGLNEQMMLPPFDSTLWKDQPLGQVASMSALFPGQAPIAPDAAQSHLQDTSFDLYQADWTNYGAGMTAAMDPFADNVR